MLTSFTLRAGNKTRMLIISGDPNQQSRTRRKSQAEGKAGVYGGRSQVDSWGAILTWHQNVTTVLKH